MGQRLGGSDSVGAGLSGRLRGIYRLARHWLRPTPSALALAFFALNPNLLYLQTTAMTEPLFVCEMVWIAVWLVEWRASLDADPRKTRRLLWCDCGGADCRNLHALRRLGDGADCLDVHGPGSSTARQAAFAGFLAGQLCCWRRAGGMVHL